MDLNFNNHSKAAIFLDIEKAFNTTLHPGLLCKLIILNFLVRTVKLISSFLSNGKFKVLVEGEMSTPREIKAGVPQDSVLSHVLYNLYINDALQTTSTQLAVFANDACIYATNRKEGFTIRKLQRGRTATEAWCELWNIKINEDKISAIYFSHGSRPVKCQHTLRGRNITLVNNVKYLGANVDRKISWRPHIERIKAKPFRTFIITYSLFKSERLNINLKLTLYKALIRSVMTYACHA